MKNFLSAQTSMLENLQESRGLVKSGLSNCHMVQALTCLAPHILDKRSQAPEEVGAEQ
jgi:hypothetical protein